MYFHVIAAAEGDRQNASSSKGLGPSFRREWVLPGRRLLAWASGAQEGMLKASAGLRLMVEETNRGKCPSPILMLSNHQAGLHASHTWVKDFEVDLDHGYSYVEVILRELEARRVAETVVPKRYKLLYQEHTRKK